MPIENSAEGPQLSDLIALSQEELAEHMLEPATMQAIYEDTTAIINSGRTPETLYALVESAIDTMKSLWEDLSSDSPAADCHKGCSWCCHQTVMVTAPEALWAARFIREHFSEQEVAKLQGRLATRTREIAGLTNEERIDKRIPCAFLVDDICAIYPARPMQCRGGFSSDAEFCRQIYEDRPTVQAALAEQKIEGKYLLAPKMLYDSAQTGMAGALRNDGLNVDPLELTAALAIALSDPKVTETWLKGWQAFTPARLHRRESSGPAPNYATEPV